MEHGDAAATGDAVESIFCINAGRSGSGYLTTLFKHVAGCRALHEPSPRCDGPAMRAYLLGNPEPMREPVREKVAKIHDVRREHDLYVETSHHFIKGFGWLLPEHLSESKMGVIILTRDKAKVAASLFRLGVFPLMSSGRRLVITPDAAGPLVAPPRRLLPARLTYSLFRLLKLPFRGGRVYARLGLPKPRVADFIVRYELDCLEWYVDEVLARARAYQERFPGVRYFETTVEALNDPREVERMLAHFGCTALPTITDVVGAPANLKEEREYDEAWHGRRRG